MEGGLSLGGKNYKRFFQLSLFFCIVQISYTEQVFIL